MNDRDRKFQEPASIEEAENLMLRLQADIMSIERQLAEPSRNDRNGNPMSKKEYRQWRSAAHSSLVFKKINYSQLKHWITVRRRQIEAGKIGIFDPNDPRELLVRARVAMKKALDGDDSELGVLYNVIDQYLQHAA